ncbi:MAG: glycosyltransferase [Chloroflexota bacterium]
MALAVIFLRIVYLACITTLILYTTGQIYVLYTYIRHYPLRSSNNALPPLPEIAADKLPTVTVQLPLFNERYVARRIIEAAAALDYPHDRLTIQVLDDSIDDTTELIQARIQQLQTEGLAIDLIHRTDRVGYKAGALANGLCHSQSEFVAIFDADFVPQPDFLRKTVPYFLTDECIGVVQARWGHLNDTDNLLTRSQALAIDSHFAVEQYARFAGNLIFPFNGSCGLWRRRCIEDAGGWHTDTLTEDFDLSYRAQIKGWRFIFVRDVVVPGEVPAQMAAYRQQQSRWAKGSTQVLLKLANPLLHSNLSLRQRIMGLLQLFQYAIQPVMLLTLLLTPLMILTHSLIDLSIAPVGIMGLGAPLLCMLGQQALYYDWVERSLYFPFLTLFASGMAVNNSRASIGALVGKPSEFKRTPKFHLDGNSSQQSRQWQRSHYSALTGSDVWWEIGFGLYALSAALLSYQIAPSFTIYFAVYATAFLGVAGWEFMDRLTLLRPVPNPETETLPQASR